METNVIWRNARAAVIELDDGGYFTCADTWEIFVNDEPAGTTNTVETYVDGLTPDKRNLIRFVCGERELSVGVTTPAEPLPSTFATVEPRAMPSTMTPPTFRLPSWPAPRAGAC